MFTLAKARSTMVLTRAGARMLPRVTQDKYVLIHKPKEKKFTMKIINDEEAEIMYNKRGNIYVLVHSHVPEQYRGQGIGRTLAEKTYQYIAEHNLEFRILCSFLLRVYKEHEALKMDELDIKAKIFYYCREKCYNCMLTACQDGINRFRGDLSFNFYRSLSLFLCNQIQNSIHELESLKSESDYRLSAAIALTYVYQNYGEVQKDIFSRLETQVRELKKIASPQDIYNSAYTFYILKKFSKAREFIEKALIAESTNPEYLCLKGWIELQLLPVNPTNETIKISEIFETALKSNRRNLDSSLGLAESFVVEKNYEEAMNVLNKAIVRFPSIHLALIQKMNLEFAQQNWDQCFDILNRIMILESENLATLKMNILLLICKDAKYEESANLLQKFNFQLDKLEPKNGVLLLNYAQLFSRLCGRNELILAETYKMVEKALDNTTDKVKYMVELAYQCFLQDKFKEAIRLYKSASKLDDSSIEALMGLTLCDISENGKTEQSKHQVEFLTELQENNISPVILLMQAKLSDRSDESLKLLNQICDIKADGSTLRVNYNHNYLTSLDPDFILTVAKEFLLHIPQPLKLLSNEKNFQESSTLTNRIENLLKVIVKICPGLQEASYLLSKIQLLNGDATKAKNTLEQILSNVDNSFSEGYLLMAQIQVFTEQYERAAQSLEIGLSHNFKVRENPIYHFISGAIEKTRNNLIEAIQCFTTALHMFNNKSTNEFSLSDKASIYIELIDAYTQTNQLHEATKLIEAAIVEFRGSTEEVRMIILNAEQAIASNDIQNAINMLSRVQPTDPYYFKAKTKLANIFLEYRKDSKAYLRCFQEMVSSNPVSESYILLGDAYLYILEIEKSLEAYEKALETNPKDPYLCSKMGKALVKTHYYAKAVSYYREAVSLTDNPDLKLQLIELHINLQQFDKAEMMLTSEIENENSKNVEDIFSLQYKVKLLTMLAEIHQQANNISGALKDLQNAKDNQNRVLKRLSLEEVEVSTDEKKTIKSICTKLAQLCISNKDNERAISFYKEALSIFPGDTQILTDLAKLYMLMNNMELCQQTCAMLLKVDPDNEHAFVMMADIAFRKIDFDMATFHFTQLLTKQPTNWNALVRYIEVVRRTGELDEVPHYLQQAELFSVKSGKNAGYSYCTALYQWYCGNLNGALRNFNNARSDSEWGKKAIYNMIEICLNPEDEMLGDQLFDSEDSEYRDSRTMALQTADRLLKELKQKSQSIDDNLTNRLLGNFLLLASKEKFNIEKALEDFTSIASLDPYKSEIGPILGMASAYTLLKQSQRAKNQLKRVSKTFWSFEDAEHLERCWLLLADYYIQSSKYELASELLKRILQYNKACTKAYELSGFIAEKEQNYREATIYYDSAWKFGGKTNPTVGYKLAFNSMKCKKYAEAIDVCQQVLKTHPDYPRIRKDILDKALNNLRT